MVIESNQPLGPFVAFGEAQRGGGELHRPPVHARLRIYTERQADGRRRPAEITESTEIEIEPRIGGEERTQPLDGRGGGNNQGEVCRRPVRVLLEAREEKGLVLANRPAHSESSNVAAEDGFGRAIQFVEIGDRIETLRLIPPE